MSALLGFAAISGALLGGFLGLFHQEVKQAEKATGGTCAIVSNSGSPEDVLLHLHDGEILMPPRHLGGDHQIACIPAGAMTRQAAGVRLKDLHREAERSRAIRECAAIARWNNTYAECGR